MKRFLLTMYLTVSLLPALSGSAAAYDYDYHDFVVEVADVNDIEPGTHDDPDSALGRPAVDTAYGFPPEYRPVLPVYPAWQSDELYTIDTGGHLTLRFDHKVSDDENNPYGVDFIVFGNAFFEIGQNQDWLYADPQDVIITEGSLYTEPGKISVSQDGVTWYAFDSSDPDVPYVDDFAPTLGRIYDPDNPEISLGSWNLWWGGATNPTVPLDPNLTARDFYGMRLGEVCLLYGESAGGTGFDLKWLASEDYESLRIDPQTGRRWIQYIRFETRPGSSLTPEIDAVSDAAACGDYKRPFPVGDLNHDCIVDGFDLAILSRHWLESSLNNE